jgi:N-acetylneuraminate synthase
MAEVTLPNGRTIGQGHPTYIIAEIGINHNGELYLAKRLLDEAKRTGCDAVKLQKRTPEICVPKDQWEKRRETPWGEMSYIDYKRRIEFGRADYEEIDAHCKKLGLDWTASCWDIPSVEFIDRFNPPFYKMASASLTDLDLLGAVKRTGKPIMISTGMSTIEEIDAAVEFLGEEGLMIAHSTSAYPCDPTQLNLNMIPRLQERFPKAIIGYSGHETGLTTTVAAVTLGATFVERHFTLDRAMWGTDHAASVEPVGMERLVRDIRTVETGLGDGVKRVYDSELEPRKRLRGV